MGTVNRGESTTELPGLPDRWRVLAELKAGGRASVWIAEDLELGEQVVLKIFPPFDDAEFRARALVEISLGQRLQHEHLVRLYDVVEVGPRLVAAMEWMSGGSLSQRINFEGEQPIPCVVQWAGHALDVLAYLHGENLVHRDVKPSNLLLDRDDELKLSDLGLVGRFDRGRYLPETRAAVGTPGYMAPEQLHDREPAPSWDLYALGVTLRQLLVGRRAAADQAAPPATAMTEQPKPGLLRERRPDCPAWLDQFVVRLLAERPVDRWPSAREALDVFEAQRGD
jgi:serine/threonine protein kinase